MAIILLITSNTLWTTVTSYNHVQIFVMLRFLSVCHQLLSSSSLHPGMASAWTFAHQIPDATPGEVFRAGIPGLVPILLDKQIGHLRAPIIPK